MFESSFKTAADLDREAAEGRSRDEIASLRLAALILAFSSLLAIASAALMHRFTGVVPIVIGLFLAWYLYRLRPRAEALALGLAAVWAILTPATMILRLGVLRGVVAALPALGLSVALVLLLTGRQSFGRRVAATVVYVVLAVCVSALGIAALLRGAA